VDLENLDSGEFARTILSQIEAREHFIVLPQPWFPDQIGEGGDWLRREIAHALAPGNNVVPVTANGSEFRRDLTLPPDMARLPSGNAVQRSGTSGGSMRPRSGSVLSSGRKMGAVVC
jgi:hypothetical protein